MKGTENIKTRDDAKRKGRMIAIAIHIGLIGLLAFPFLKITSPNSNRNVQIVLDFSSGSSNSGVQANLVKKAVELPKPKPKPVVTQSSSEIIEAETDPVPEIAPIPEPIEEVPNPTNEIPKADASGHGAKGAGDAEKGDSANGNGRGFIEGTGALQRAIIDRGNQRKFARENGTVVLKICINRRGNVIHAE